MAYLVGGLILSSCATSWSAQDPITRKVEGACPLPEPLVLEVNDELGTVYGSTTLYDADCNPVELAASAYVISQPVVPPEGGTTSQSAGTYTCEAGVSVSVAGVTAFNMYTTEYYILQPFSNITDWSDPPIIDANLTTAGSFLYDRITPTGYTVPVAQFSPGIYSAIFTHAQSGISYPKAGLPGSLWRLRVNFDVTIHSPAYYNPPKVSPDCIGGYTFDEEGVWDDIPGIGAIGIDIAGAIDRFCRGGWIPIC